MVKNFLEIFGLGILFYGFNLIRYYSLHGYKSYRTFYHTKKARQEMLKGLKWFMVGLAITITLKALINVI